MMEGEQLGAAEGGKRLRDLGSRVTQEERRRNFSWVALLGRKVEGLR